MRFGDLCGYKPHLRLNQQNLRNGVLIDKPFKGQTIVGAVFNRTYLLYAFDLFCL